MSTFLTKKKVIVKARIEYSTHDGHCTDNECEYTTRIVKRTIEVPLADSDEEEHSTTDHSDDEESIHSDEEEEDEENSKYEQYLEEYAESLSNTCGSCYCSLSDECIEQGLSSVHSHRITIVSADVISYS